MGQITDKHIRYVAADDNGNVCRHKHLDLSRADHCAWGYNVFAAKGVVVRKPKILENGQLRDLTEQEIGRRRLWWNLARPYIPWRQQPQRMTADIFMNL